MPEAQVSIISELKNNMREALEEVFGTTFGVPPQFIPADASATGLTAIIGLSDGVSGFLAIHMAPEHACKFASVMLSDSFTQVNDIVCDAMGELANMLGGSMKKSAGRTGELFRISVPTIVLGKDYSTHQPKDSEQIMVGVKALSSLLTIQLVVTAHH